MKTTSKFPSLRRVVLWTAGLMTVLSLATFVFISMQIGASVCEILTAAMQQHPGDRVETLIRYVEDEGHGLRNRNRAVWALGQLGDRRALPVLQRYYSGGPCDHSTVLCQRELGKAIKLVNGGVNVTAFIWRHSSAKHANGAAQPAAQTFF